MSFTIALNIKVGMKKSIFIEKHMDIINLEVSKRPTLGLLMNKNKCLSYKEFRLIIFKMITSKID